jgi:hypothetical protein
MKSKIESPLGAWFSRNANEQAGTGNEQIRAYMKIKQPLVEGLLSADDGFGHALLLSDESRHITGEVMRSTEGGASVNW